MCIRDSRQTASPGPSGPTSAPNPEHVPPNDVLEADGHENRAESDELGVGVWKMCIRDSVWGALHVAQRQWVNEIPFIHIVLLTALGNPIIYLAAMGIGLGALVTSQVAGVPYLIFVAPALLVSTVATSGAGWGTWPIMGGFKWEKNYFAASATSVTPGQIALGETIGMTARLILQLSLIHI